MIEIGSLVDGKYRILSEIGHGGMSVVYMAINEKANKTWAIKEIRRTGTQDFEVVKQGLIVETDMLKNLNHPNLPSIIDVIEDDDTFLIVMDYIEGNPLSKSLEEYGAQPQELVVEWAKQLCDVLGYLHSRNPAIIYRDMKPSNVMLKPDGNVTLIDFGTAREFKEKNLADTTCLGTVGYAAPEQFGGMGQTDARTDIYCLGATLYHLVTGCNPCEPPYEIQPIRQVNPMLSSGLERIIQKCCQRNPADRYQSCAELRYDLDNYEKIDDVYRNKQKRKLGAFIATLTVSAALCITGIVTGKMFDNMATDRYNELLEEVDRTSDYEDKAALCEEAILVANSQGRPEAYLKLIETFKLNDYVFSLDEEKTLVNYLKSSKADLINSPDGYADICFELGKLYWYYYQYGNTGDNQITRMKASVSWFDETLNYCNEDYVNYGMAEIYRDIGIFYRDISIKTVEANDKGEYAPFWENLNSLVNTVTESDNESEIVKLELYELVRNAMQQYANKFKADGITKEDMQNTYNTIKDGLDKVDATTDKTMEMRSTTLEYMDATQKAIDTAYDR